MIPIVAVQCWLARAALRWSVPDLARAAEVSSPTVRQFERGGEVKADFVEAIQHALEKAGVILIGADDGGPGIKLESTNPAQTATTADELSELRRQADELRKRLNRLTDHHG